MEMAKVGAKTRARAAALAMPAVTSPKRRKININDQQHRKLSPSSFIHLKSSRSTSAAVVIKPEKMSPPLQPDTEEGCSSPSSDEFSASCCSSNGSIGLGEERIEFLELEVDSAQDETSTCNYGDERREMSDSRKVGTNSQDLESMENSKPTEANSLMAPQKMPTDLELQEFFDAAEKDIQKQFKDKYNYDFVKDMPLEGRYEWVQLKP